MFKRLSILWALMFASLFTACGGRNSEQAAGPTFTPDLPPATPTATPVPTPTPTPDIAAGFETYMDPFGRVAFRYPPDWDLIIVAGENGFGPLRFRLASDAEIWDTEGDASLPAGFVFGEISLVTRPDTPEGILADTKENFLTESASPTGEVVVWERDGMQFASQDFEIADDAGNQLQVTLAVIVNQDKYGLFLYGATATGADEYLEITRAIFRSITVYPSPQANAIQTAHPSEVTSPEDVLQKVFEAARSGDFAVLADLCDPLGENDRDTQQICLVATDEAAQKSFVEYFASGQINGSAVISPDGTMAEVPFLFGPNGDQEATMTLIKRNGRWYLFDF